MRPIHLSFAGLRSYRAPAEIDFTDLDLFAVIGDTGAGKSTIIEALSLALYARKTWRGGAGIEDMIADGERLFRVELTFAAAEAEWQVTRTRSRGAAAGVNKLVCLTAAERVDGAVAVTERVTELIGLDHDQFTRAVVMPQGRFDELLRATKSERGKLLGSILGLDDVRAVGRGAAQLAERFRDPLALARIRRTELPADPPGALAAARAEVLRAAARLSGLQAAIERAETSAAEAATARVALDRLLAAQAAMPPGDGSDAVTVLRGAHAAGVRLLAVRAAAAVTRDGAAAEVAALDQQAGAALAGFAGRDAVVAAVTALRRSATDLAEATATLDAARQRVIVLDAAAPEAAVPPALVAALDEAAAALVLARTTRDAAEADVASGRLAGNELVAARRRVEAADQAVVAAGERVSLAASARATTQAVVEATARDALATEADHRAAATAAAAAAAARHCAPGAPCPVCTRPLPADFAVPASADLDAAEARRSTAVAAASAARDESSRGAADLAHLEAALTVAVEQAEAESCALEVATASAVAAGLIADAADLDGALTPLQIARAAASVAAGDAEDVHGAARDRVTAARTAADAARAAYEREQAAATTAVLSAERRVGAIVAGAGELPPPWRPGGPITARVLADTAERVAAMIGALDTIDTARRAAESAQVEADATVNGADRQAHEAVIQPVQQTLGELGARWGRMADLAAALVAAGAVEGLDGAPSLASVPVRATTSELAGAIDAVVAALAVGQRLAAAATTAIAALTCRHGDLSAEVAVVLDGVGACDLGAARHAAGVAQAGAAAAGVEAEQAAAAVDRATALDRFLAVARPFVAELDVLTEALRDKHFLGHLVKARETELLAEATRRLRTITGGRFGFVTDFGVVSVASGEVRSPDTLSGGERFQAALALALALVEIASRGGGRLDAVFVDEGFGSLDTAALDTALATLGTVAGGGKLVALISHLRPVADYVETVLHVTKDDMLGSRITRLTPDNRDRLLADDIRSGLTA